MSTASGVLTSQGIGSVTFTPTAGQIFSITLGATPTGLPLTIPSPVLIMRSVDAGANFAPASPLVSSFGGVESQITITTSFDVVEQRANVVYAIMALADPPRPIAYRFDQ